MAEARLARVILWVKDPLSLADWYCDAFSWNESFRDEEAGWVEIDAGGFCMALHGGATVTARKWPKLQIAVGDVAATRERLMAKGIEFGTIFEWKHQIWCECTDPEGNTVQICKS